MLIHIENPAVKIMEYKSIYRMLYQDTEPIFTLPQSFLGPLALGYVF